MNMRKSVCFFLLLSTLTSFAYAKEDIRCHATAWPYSRKQDKKSYFKLMRSMERDALIEYFFHEITEPTDSAIAYYLYKYLFYTEQNEDLKGFYDLMRWASELNSEKSKPRKLAMAEVCKYYKKAVELAQKDDH